MGASICSQRFVPTCTNQCAQRHVVADDSSPLWYIASSLSARVHLSIISRANHDIDRAGK